MGRLDADRLLVQGQFGPDCSLLTRARVSQQLDQAGEYGMNLLVVKTDGPHTSYTSHGQSCREHNGLMFAVRGVAAPVRGTLPPTADYLPDAAC
ncbi:hypothetical protein BM1_07136 [Bipolaris maydis]|nr:hypothetical protein BM1_07136 [Bipolaris maydis]